MKTDLGARYKAKRRGTNRREQLVSIAMNVIATKGFEGLRFQAVAKEAGINNATLYYHFQTKEALIQGVVAKLFTELRKTRGFPKDKPATALQELRLEFQDLRDLLRTQPKLFIVVTELSLRGLRDPAIGEMEKRRDGLWRDHLSSIIRLGIEQGVFRRSIHVGSAVTSLMAQFKGIGYHATLGARKRGEVDAAIAEIARQVERWLTCKSE